VSSAEDDYRHGIYDPRFNTWVDLLNDVDNSKLARSKAKSKPLPAKRRSNHRRAGTSRRKQIVRLYERDGHNCRWCGVELSLLIPDPRHDTCTLRHPTIDHYPEKFEKGGDNSDSNAVLSCEDCNIGRSNKKHVSRWRDCD
jgi:hypothetical protein